MVENSDRIPIQSDVIIAPHHGADNGSSNRFIEAVSPHYVIFPAGHNRTFQHPRAVAAERYLAHGVPLNRMFRTDRNDDDGPDEWSHERIPGHRDPAFDDDIEIVIRSSGELEVAYAGEAPHVEPFESGSAIGSGDESGAKRRSLPLATKGTEQPKPKNKTELSGDGGPKELPTAPPSTSRPIRQSDHSRLASWCALLIAGLVLIALSFAYLRAALHHVYSLDMPRNNSPIAMIFTSAVTIAFVLGCFLIAIVACQIAFAAPAPHTSVRCHDGPSGAGSDW